MGRLLTFPTQSKERKPRGSRANFKVVIPDRLYQRGNFLTWPRRQKERLLEQHKIDIIVNLWAKPDPEVTEDSGRIYFHIPMGSSVDNPKFLETIVSILSTNMKFGMRVLVHCEAGVNRSVFLCSLLVAELLDLNGEQALSYVQERCGRTKVHHALKKYIFEAYP